MANYLSWQLYSSLFRPPGYHVLILVQTTWLSCTLLCSDPLSTMYSSLFRPQVFHLLVFCICTDHLVIHNVLVFVQTPTCLTSTRLCFEHVVNIVFVLTTRLPSSLFRPRGYHCLYSDHVVTIVFVQTTRFSIIFVLTTWLSSSLFRPRGYRRLCSDHVVYSSAGAGPTAGGGWAERLLLLHPPQPRR